MSEQSSDLAALFGQPAGTDPDPEESRTGQEASSPSAVLFASEEEADSGEDIAGLFTFVPADSTPTAPLHAEPHDGSASDKVELKPRARQLPPELAAVSEALAGAGDRPAPLHVEGWKPPSDRPNPAETIAPNWVAQDQPDTAKEVSGLPGPSGRTQPEVGAPPAPHVSDKPETGSEHAVTAPVPVDTLTPPAAHLPAFATQDRRISDSARLWPIVDQVLAVTSSDPVLQAKASDLAFTRDPAEDSAQKGELFDVLKPRLAANGIQIPDPRDVTPVLQMAYDEILGISVLGDLWRDPDVTEIMVDRWDHIVIERNGLLENTHVRFRDPEHANSVARSLALRVSDRAVSRSIPLVTAELPKARVTFAYGPVVKGGLSITIRKFKDLIGLQALLQYGSLDRRMVDFLRDAVSARAGILVSGGTGSGKTTVINLLSSFIPDSERVITIEDAFELQLSNTHVVALQTKEASSRDDTVEVTLADLLRNTLRMRPDRIIVGEIREGEGAIVMLAAASTGHDGTMTTLHANNADMAVNERLVDLARMVRGNSDDRSLRRSVVNAFDLVVQVTRGRGGRRYIAEVSALKGIGPDGAIVLEPVFQATQHTDGTVAFHFAGLDPETALAARLDEKGTLAKWQSQHS